MGISFSRHDFFVIIRLGSGLKSGKSFLWPQIGKGFQESCRKPLQRVPTPGLFVTAGAFRSHTTCMLLHRLLRKIRFVQVVTLLTFRGSLLAIFSASSLLRLRSLDKSPATGSNCNYNKKELTAFSLDSKSNVTIFTNYFCDHSYQLSMINFIKKMEVCEA